MINISTSQTVSARDLVKPVQEKAQMTSAFKGNLTQDIFVKNASQKDISFKGIFDWDIFKVPKVIRKNPELKQLANNAIKGDVAAYNKLIESDKISPKKLDEVKEYVKTNLITGCYSEPTTKKASAIVEMVMVSDMTKNMIHSKGRIKDLEELPALMKGLGWVEAYKTAKDTAYTNKKVLDSVLETSNPKNTIAHEQFMNAIYNYLDDNRPCTKEKQYQQIR